MGFTKYEWITFYEKTINKENKYLVYIEPAVYYSDLLYQNK
mgnify:CR=1 FL=1